MSRLVYFLTNDIIRARVRQFIKDLPFNSRVELKEPKRTIPQNDRMWAMLSDLAKQATHFGRVYSPEIWKCIMMHELGKQCEFVPSLDGSTVIPLGYHSSDLSISEMCDLMTVMEEWGARKNIVFHTARESA